MKGELPPVSKAPSPVWERASRNLAMQMTEPRGSFEIFLPTPTVCVTRARGHLSFTLARLLPEALAPHFAERRSFALFHDWEEMTTYDSGARRLLTNWVLANTQTLSSLEFVVGSRIVAMGVAAANVATSIAGLTLVAYTNRSEFERALSRFV